MYVLLHQAPHFEHLGSVLQDESILSIEVEWYDVTWNVRYFFYPQNPSPQTYGNTRPSQ